MRDTKLDSLAPEFRPVVFELLARLTEAGILVKIIQTWRTEEEHQADLASGASWTKVSKHQRKVNGKAASWAIDVCPFSVYTRAGSSKLNWDGRDPAWQEIGRIGKSLGLRWGGDFKPPAKPDLGHLEYLPPKPKEVIA